MSETSPLVSAVGSGPKPKKLYAVGAEFANPKELYEAAEKVRDQGFKGWDCYTPYYIHGLDRAMGQKKSFVGLFTFAGGLAGSPAASSSSRSPRSTSIRWIPRASPTSACPALCRFSISS